MRDVCFTTSFGLEQFVGEIEKVERSAVFDSIES
jgi:hypothetical protein